MSQPRRIESSGGIHPALNQDGRRVEKPVYDRSTSEVTLLQRFIYEGWNLVGTLDVEGEGEQQFAILNTRYVWRTGSEDTGSFGLLMVAGDHDGDPTNLPRAYYPGYDGRGNLTSLAENRQGVAAAAWEYSPFGEVLRAEASAELPSPRSLGATFGFATQYTDAETGLVYFGRRYYHPGMGRFLNKDPLGEAGGLNRYAYALNDPVNRTDYRGLCYTGPVPTAGWRYLNSFGNPVYFESVGFDDHLDRVAPQGRKRSPDEESTGFPQEHQGYVGSSGASWGSSTRDSSVGNSEDSVIYLEPFVVNGRRWTFFDELAYQMLGPQILDLMQQAYSNLVTAYQLEEYNYQQSLEAISGSRPWTRNLAIYTAERLKRNSNGAFVPAPKSILGNPLYYVFRYHASSDAYKNDEGKEYFLEYGYKYAIKFTDLIGSVSEGSRMSSFLVNTRRELQVQLEGELLVAPPENPIDRKFVYERAFQTHDVAYREGGFGNLSLLEQLRVAAVVDLNDLFSEEALREAWESIDMIKFPELPKPAGPYASSPFIIDFPE